MRNRKNDKVLKPVHPNPGIEAEFRRTLRKLLDQMHASVMRAVEAAYRKNTPEIAVDTLPARELEKILKQLEQRWLRRFDTTAPRLAKYFSQTITQRSDAVLRNILRGAGLSVDFKMSKMVQDVLAATMSQQVGLIKSIPAQYLTHVQGSVMRSVAAGRDLKQLTDDLQKNYKVSRDRATFIARDQNNKATATITRARQVELGITEAIWMHSGGGREPRPTHVKAGRDKQRYDVTRGWYDPAEKKRIYPGELINCRCVSLSVVPGFA